jgi:hypothetical protein
MRPGEICHRRAQPGGSASARRDPPRTRSARAAIRSWRWERRGSRRIRRWKRRGRSRGPRGFRRLPRDSAPAGGASYGRAWRATTVAGELRLRGAVAPAGTRRRPPLASSFFLGHAGANCLLPMREGCVRPMPASLHCATGTSAYGGFFADAGRDTARDSLSTSVGWIETSTRTAPLNNSSVGLGHQHDQLKQLQNDRSSRIGTLIRVSTTLFRRRCKPPHTAKKQTLSSPPLKGDSTAYFSPNTNH